MWSASLNQSTEVIPASLVLHNSNTNLYLLSEIVPVNTGLSPSLNFKVTLLISTTSISCFCTGLVGQFLMKLLFVCVEVLAQICYNKNTGKNHPVKSCNKKPHGLL